jgi:hypothetical protein
MRRARKRVPSRPARRPSALRKKGQPAKARRRPPSSRAGARGDPRPVAHARRELDHAAEAVRAAAAALAHVADQIGAEALEGERGRLAAELASEQILRDLAKLQRAFTAAPEGSLPADIEVLRKLPDAVLAWARDRFSVTPHLAVGQELEVPASRLSGFLLDGTLPSGGGLVRVRVVSPGWKRGPLVLVPARALIV